MQFTKVLFRSVLALLAAGLLFSCKGKEQVTPEPVILETTLAQLLEKSTASSQEFDIQIKDLVVTAVYENYAQLEDGTCGAQLNKTDHGLKAGQKIEGHVGIKARAVSGALVLSALNTGAATVTEGATIPCTTLTLAQVMADKGTYTNRRVKLENVTFVNGFNGTAGGSGTFSQKGVQISATCRPEGVVIADGAQGDLICYPSSAACYVFSGADFTEHEIQLPITAIKTVGVYSQASTQPQDKKAYRAGTDQYSWTVSSSDIEFRLQNYHEEWVLAYKFPAKYKLGQQISLKSSPIGLADFQEGNIDVFVEKQADGLLWLMDYATDTGYVFRVE